MASVSASASARDNALARVSARHVHQCLWLPETQEHPRLRVTYATTSNFEDASLPAVLFIPPMFGSRWFALEMDKLARDTGVRVVFPERYCSTLHLSYYVPKVPHLTYSAGLVWAARRLCR